MTATSYHTLIEALDAAPPEKPFVTFWQDEDAIRTVTFGEFRRDAAGYAAFLQAQGLRPHDTSVLILPQGIELMAAFAATMMLGAVPAILAYPNFKVEPAKYCFGLSGVSANLKARLIVIDDAFPDQFLEHISVAEGTQIVRLPVSTADTGDLAAPPTIDPDETAFIQHSGGTTGLQKGVALSHRAVLRHVVSLSEALDIRESDVVYSWLPLYHDMGLIACFMLPMVRHLHVVMQSPTEWVMQPGTMPQLISQYRCTLAWAPNFTFQFLARRVRAEDRQDFDLSSLRALVNCSEPVRAESVSEFMAAYAACGLDPGAVRASYAMAENVFAVTQSGMGGAPVQQRAWVDAERYRLEGVAAPVEPGALGALCFVSSGRCLSGNEVRIVSPVDDPLPDGSVGEILIRSDTLFNGYYNRPDLTQQAMRGEWYQSGDLGFLLDGELYVVGRKKDLIIVAGKNVYPQDVEEIVCSHPAIHDGRAVAFGLFNVSLGTEDIAVIAEVNQEEHLQQSASICAAIRSAVASELGVAVKAVHLKPRGWLVKSTAGKPARAATREKALREHPELVPEGSQ